MEHILEASLLYDFYGVLLTKRQQQVFEMYYQNDLSLSEIGEELSISRQAVNDLIHRTEKILRDFEEKLGLVQRFMEEKRHFIKIQDLVSSLEKESDLDDKAICKVEEIKSILNLILS
ncbi:MAG: YlxM family DNA-binding protein [Clostridiales bacterium]|nr:YlxM family DNA-binding protein [Clostridiales bacterium]